jgi:hypothetical protein
VDDVGEIHDVLGRADRDDGDLVVGYQQLRRQLRTHPSLLTLGAGRQDVLLHPARPGDGLLVVDDPVRNTVA